MTSCKPNPHKLVGDSLRDHGDPEEALKRFRTAIDIYRRLDATQRHFGWLYIVWQRELAVEYSRVGDTLLARARLEEALETLRIGLVAIASRRKAVAAKEGAGKTRVAT